MSFPHTPKPLGGGVTDPFAELRKILAAERDRCALLAEGSRPDSGGYGDWQRGRVSALDDVLATLG